METDQQRRRARTTVMVVVVGLYWLAIFVATHVPNHATPVKEPFPRDKVQHLMAFAGLSALLCGLGTLAGIPSWRVYGGVVLLIAAYGVVDEVSQMLVRGRTADLFDWLADVAGAILGVCGFAFVRQFMTRHRATHDVTL